MSTEKCRDLFICLNSIWSQVIGDFFTRLRNAREDGREGVFCRVDRRIRKSRRVEENNMQSVSSLGPTVNSDSSCQSILCPSVSVL